MTNCTRAGGCAGCNYPFLTLKERDNETGLDYFLARYYSSSQGRFTSPDEFSGGPDELYTFSDYASDNPTFYADLRNPQSLNKYQYTYNSPLNLTDNDGHCPECKKVGEKLIQAADAVADAKIGVDKAGINMLIGMNNVSASFGIGDYIEPLQPTSRVQDFAMQETEKITFVASFLGGRGPANVVSAESKTTARVVAETAQVSVAPKIGEVGGGTLATKPYVRPAGATTRAQRASVQGQPCTVCGESAPKMYAGHKNALVKEHYTTGTINKTRMRELSAVQSECPTCSNVGGGKLSGYSRAMKKEIP